MKPKPGPSPALVAYHERIKAVKAGLPVEPEPVMEKPKPTKPPPDLSEPTCSKCQKRDRYAWDVNGSLLCGKCCRDYFDDSTRTAIAHGAKCTN